MSAIAASLVKELRERTGIGMMSCKQALLACDGDLDAAIAHLRRNSGLKADSRAGRSALEGVIAAAVTIDGSRAYLLEVNCETDFVARDVGFLRFVAQTLASAEQHPDIASLRAAVEDARHALVQKTGENVQLRRLAYHHSDGGHVHHYVHSNRRIGALVELHGDGAADSVLGRDVAMHMAAMNPAVVRPEDMPTAVVDRERKLYQAQAKDSGKTPEIAEKMAQGRMKKFLAANSLVEQAFVRDPSVTVGQLTQRANAELRAAIRFEVGAEMAAQAGAAPAPVH